MARRSALSLTARLAAINHMADAPLFDWRSCRLADRRAHLRARAQEGLGLTAGPRSA
jgi:hypothetical protein